MRWKNEKSEHKLEYDESAEKKLKRLEFELAGEYFGYKIFRAKKLIPTTIDNLKLVSEVFVVSKNGIDDAEGYCFFRVNPKLGSSNNILYDFMTLPGIQNSVLDTEKFCKWTHSNLVYRNNLKKVSQIGYSQIFQSGISGNPRISDLLPEKE